MAPKTNGKPDPVRDSATEPTAGLPAVIGNFAVVKIGDPGSVAEIIRENLGGARIGALDLDRIKVPSGGQKAWTLPSISGDQFAGSFEGVILFARDTRRLWRVAFEQRTEAGPPDCASEDGETGRGDPAGVGAPQTFACARCPFAQWGSDPKNQKGQACKQFKLLFVLRPNELLPTVLSVPPSSLANLKKYLLRLTSGQVPYWRVLTRFELEITKNGSNIDYAVVKPSLAGQLNPAEAEVIKSMRAALEPVLKTYSDVEDAEPAAASA
jgi:hypothetical protein